MAKHLLHFLIITATTRALVSTSEFKRFFIDRTQNFSDFQKYSLNVSESIKNLTIATPKSRVELGVMGYEFVNKIHDSIFYLNKVLLNINDEGFHNKLDKVINKYSDMVNEFQHVLHSSDSSKIKEKIVYSSNIVLEGCVNILDIVIEYQDKIPLHVYNPFQVGVQRALYSTHQFKDQAKFFNKNNKEVTSEVKHYLTVLETTFLEITSENDELHKELLYQIVQTEHILDKTVLNLESWVQLNSNETKNVKTIKEVLKEMSAIYGKLHNITNSDHTVFYIASNFSHIYHDYTMLIVKVGQLDTEENHGTQEYIRTILLNSISISKLFTNELRLLF